MTIENIADILSEKYDENYGYIYDLAIHTTIKLIKRDPSKYIMKNYQLLKDTETLLDRYYQMKAYKEGAETHGK